MSTLADKVNASSELTATPLNAAQARPMTTVTAPVLCLGVALGVAAAGVAVGYVYGEVAD
jgi:hypothetical protein